MMHQEIAHCLLTNALHEVVALLDNSRQFYNLYIPFASLSQLSWIFPLPATHGHVPPSAPLLAGATTETSVCNQHCFSSKVEI